MLTVWRLIWCWPPSTCRSFHWAWCGLRRSPRMMYWNILYHLVNVTLSDLSPFWLVGMPYHFDGRGILAADAADCGWLRRLQLIVVDRSGFSSPSAVIASPDERTNSGPDSRTGRSTAADLFCWTGQTVWSYRRHRAETCKHLSTLDVDCSVLLLLIFHTGRVRREGSSSWCWWSRWWWWWWWFEEVVTTWRTCRFGR